ncbi:MAG: hypothetical protein LBS47_00075 [Endomicrobium sp.]|jgi:ATP-dependent Clp protease ATP-binding subunit ClpB|nr:hypothetical protein [Endomicrobium sp.]
MKIHWEKEKYLISKIRQFKAELECIKTKEQQAERDGDLNTVAEIRYGKIPQMQKQLEEENKELLKLQKEKKY